MKLTKMKIYFNNDILKQNYIHRYMGVFLFCLKKCVF